MARTKANSHAEQGRAKTCSAQGLFPHEADMQAHHMAKVHQPATPPQSVKNCQVFRIAAAAPLQSVAGRASNIHPDSNTAAQIQNCHTVRPSGLPLFPFAEATKVSHMMKYPAPAQQCKHFTAATA